MSLEGSSEIYNFIKELTKDSDVIPSPGGFISPVAGGTRSTTSLGTARTPLAQAAYRRKNMECEIYIG